MSNSVVIELHVPDFKVIKEYYLKLGFELVWEREPDGAKGYLALRMGSNILCFWPGNEQAYRQGYFKRFPPETPRGYGVEIIVMVDDIEAYFEIVKDFANVVKPVVMREWGVKDFRVIDPAGYYVRFTETYDVLDPRFSVE